MTQDEMCQLLKSCCSSSTCLGGLLLALYITCFPLWLCCQIVCSSSNGNQDVFTTHDDHDGDDGDDDALLIIECDDVNSLLEPPAGMLEMQHLRTTNATQPELKKDVLQSDGVLGAHMIYGINDEP